MIGGSPKHGFDWAYGYAIVRPALPYCGFITNPDAEQMIDVRPCNRPATHEFRMPGETVVWNGACEEHAEMVRGEVEGLRAIPGEDS